MHILYFSVPSSQRQSEEVRNCEGSAFFMSSRLECQLRCELQTDPDNGDCKLFNYCEDKKLCELSFCPPASQGGGVGGRGAGKILEIKMFPVSKLYSKEKEKSPVSFSFSNTFSNSFSNSLGIIFES